jgi:signal transduction histidine kinase/uncharacterized membrane protein YagU involved in acid resistance
MGGQNYSGLVVAGIGFVLTRFTVTLAVYEDPIAFYVAGVVPMAAGLGLAAFGVALVVADVDPSLVRTAARWCLLGTGGMLVLVVLTLVGSAPDVMPTVETLRSQSYLSNFLIGGSVGGTLTGLYAAHNRRQRRELTQQANRLEVLNRLLRHEVLNAVTIIRGYASVRDEDTDATALITDRSDHIAETIDEVRHLTQSTRTDATGTTTDLGRWLEAAVSSVRADHPEAHVRVEGGDLPDDLTVRGTSRLELVFEHLLENAVVHADTEAPTVRLTSAVTPGEVRVSVSDAGPGLPEAQRALLEHGQITEFDDPQDGYGLNVVRLLAERFGAGLEVGTDETGTTVTVVLQRREDGESTTGVLASRTSLTGLRASIPHLTVVTGAALLAGVFYGIVSEWAGGSVAAIGVFYGIQDPVVGWLTHEFHSVVFAFVFVGLLSVAPDRYRSRWAAVVGLGAAWGVVVWVVAAGFVAPLWLRLLGVPVPLPSFDPTLLLSHLLWGVSLAALTVVGHQHVTPYLTRTVGPVTP